MSNWQTILDLTDVWKNVRLKNSNGGELSIFQLSKITAERLEKLHIPNSWDETIREQRDELVDNFKQLSGRQNELSEDEACQLYNYHLNDLYDWGDISLDGLFGGKKVCWVATKF